MPANQPHKRQAPWGLFLMTAAMLVLILYFGLHFKGASGANKVSWIDGRAGIHFGRYGIAHGEVVIPPKRKDRRANPALSISFAMQPEVSDDGNFRFLLLLHGGEDDHQLVIGQWRSWLIIMNGDDYNYRRRRARIAVDIMEPYKNRFVTITSGEGGTTVFIDGEQVKTKRDLNLTIPGGAGPIQLVLGNSIYGRHPWMGALYGLVFYDHVLAEPAIKIHFRQWQQEQRFAFALSENTSGLYLFDEGRGRRVMDHAAGRHDLSIPAKMTILSKEFLTAPFGHTDYSLYQDMVINVMGFIPMGFLMSALLCYATPRNLKKRLLLVMLSCGTVSIGIELAQAWIPSRSSQTLDLLLNTLGAGAGVLIHSAYHYIFGPGSPEDESLHS